MTNEQLYILLELIREEINREINVIRAELDKTKAERYMHWYNKESGARVLYVDLPDGDEYETRPTGDFKALTGLKALASELKRYSRRLENYRNTR